MLNTGNQMKKPAKMREQEQQSDFNPGQIMQMQQQQQNGGGGGGDDAEIKALYVQGALAAQQQGALQAMARMAVEPAVAGIRAGGQVGAAQASAAGQQASAETQAAAQIAASQLGLTGTLGAAETRLTGTLAQIKGQLDLQGIKGEQEWDKLIKKLKNEKDIAGIQKAASTASANIQKSGQVQAAGKSASATIQAAQKSKEASKFSAEQSLKGTQRQATATEFGATTSAEAQKATAETQAQAQKDVAQMNILGQLGGEDFGEGTIEAQSQAKQAQDLAQLQGQMGLGDESGEGTIRKQQQEQLERELGLSQESAAQQLGTGDYSESGGLIGAQSTAKIAEQQDAAKSAAQMRLGTGLDSYASLGEIAGQGAEQRKTQEAHAELAADNMQTHADILNVQQGNIADKLSGIASPFANMFGLGGASGGEQSGGEQRGNAGGLNIPNIIAGAGQSRPQTTAMNLLSGGMGNPYMQPLTGMAGMTGAATQGPNQLLAMQGAMNAQNQLGLNANQQMAGSALGAANNLSGAFNQMGATQTQALQPLSSAAGQGLAGIAQAQGAALANLGNVGAVV
jgi:hypothetical protein